MSPESGRTVPAVTIIVPVLDEGSTLAAWIGSLHGLRPQAQLLVVDGGSADDTVAVAEQMVEGAAERAVEGIAERAVEGAVERAGRAVEGAGHPLDRVIGSGRGRAIQMNAGAAVAEGDVLLFLHADTRLPSGALTLIGAAIVGGAKWGRFDVRIESDRRALGMVAWFMNHRSHLTGVVTGDQGIFVHRDLFEHVGGYPEIALMEDIALSKLLRKEGRPARIRSRVVTSPRRWEKHGVWRTITLMWALRLRYLLGADPDALAVRYGYRRPDATAH